MIYAVVFLIFLSVCCYAYLLLARFVGVVYPRNDERKHFILKRTLLTCALAIGIVGACILCDYILAFFVQAGMLAILVEFVNWGMLIASKCTKDKNKRIFAKWRTIFRLSLIPLCGALILVLYGAYHIRDVKQTEYTIESSKLSENLDVVMISDLHYPLTMSEERLQEIANRISNVKPDMVLLCGDLCDEGTTKEEMEYMFRTLGSIDTNYGVFYVYGNHDAQLYSTNRAYTEAEMEATMSLVGIGSLVDKAVTVREDITLVGRQDYSRSREALREVLAGADTSSFVIVMDHQPQEYEIDRENGADLVLSGHTHDGQVFPAGWIISLFHMADVTVGMEHFGDTTAIVSSGMVGWGFPIRTQGDSEYVLVHLKAK